MILLIVAMVVLIIVVIRFDRLYQQFNDRQRNDNDRGFDNALKSLQIDINKILENGNNSLDYKNLFSSPKLRGGLGETFLENMLADKFSKDRFSMQYQFKNSICDAVVRLNDDRLLPIDSKFTWENYKKMTDESNEAEKNKHKKKLFSDIRNRIDEVSKYILPDEGTLSIAFMYIPSESIYYDVFVMQELDNKSEESRASIQRYAFERNVIPVSPNLLYAFLEVVVIGLNGLKIEQDTRKIQQGLQAVSRGLEIFCEEYRTTKKHLRHAIQSCDKGDGHLETLKNKLDGLGSNHELGKEE